MKRGILIAVLCMLGIGIVLMGATAIFAGSAVVTGIGGAGGYTEKTLDFASEITSADIDISNTQITLRVSTDGKAHAKWYENKKVFYTVEEKGGELTVRQTDTRKWYDYIGIHIDNAKPFVIELPASALSELTVDTSNAYINCDGVNVSGNVSLKTSNAAIKLEKLTWGKCDIKTSNGLVSLDACTLGETYIKSSNAMIKAEDCAFASFRSETSNACISLDGVRADTVETETNNGFIELDDIVAASVWAKTSNSFIKVEDIRVTDFIDLKSSNGAITGSLPGKMTDYTISADTSNGSCNLPEELDGGSLRLTVKTSNGRIKIDFGD